MNIAVFSDTFLPHKNGVTSAILLEKNELEKRGHTVYIVTVGAKQVEDGSHVLRIRSLPFVGINTKQPFRIGLFDRSRIAKFLKDKQIDVIHTHTEFSLGWIGHYFARRLRVPHIHTWHTMWEDYKNVYFLTRVVIPFALLRKLLANFLSRPDTITTPTQKSAHYVLKLVPHAHVQVLQNGIPFVPLKLTLSQRKTEREKMGIPADAVVALFAGRITGEKRLDELFRIYLLAMERVPQLYLILAGDGPLLKQIRERAYRSPHKDRIILTGFVPLEQVALFNALADITTTASLSETSNMSLLEGMASGCAVLARNDLCLDGVVTNGEGGYVCQDDLEMVWRLVELASNRKQLARFGLYNSSLADRFSARTHVEALLEMYGSLLENK